MSLCRRPLLIAAIACVGLWLQAGGTRADGDEDRRVQAGLRLFRAMLAADLDLTKKSGVDGQLLILFVHSGDARRAEAAAATFARRGSDTKVEPIRGLPVRVEVMAARELPATANRPAGLFLAQNPSADAVRGLVRFGIDRRIVVYSPFEGHVEQGVLGGLAIEAQVRPFVNLKTLAASNVTLKEFFLKVAKVHP